MNFPELQEMFYFMSEDALTSAIGKALNMMTDPDNEFDIKALESALRVSNSNLHATGALILSRELVKYNTYHGVRIATNDKVNTDDDFEAWRDRAEAVMHKAFGMHFK